MEMDFQTLSQLMDFSTRIKDGDRDQRAQCIMFCSGSYFNPGLDRAESYWSTIDWFCTKRWKFIIAMFKKNKSFAWATMLDGKDIGFLVFKIQNNSDKLCQLKCQMSKVRRQKSKSKVKRLRTNPLSS